MSLRTKASLFVVVTIATILATVQLLHAQTTLERFRVIEEEQSIADLVRVENQLDFGIADLSGTAADWAYWQDTHRYVLDGNHDYETSNLYPEAFQPIDVDLLAITTADGEPRFSAWFHDADVAAIPDEFGEILSVGGALSVTEPGDSRSGLLVLDGAVMLVAARGITMGGAGDTPIGTLVMGREVGPTFVEALIAVTGLDLTVESCVTESCTHFGVRNTDRLGNRISSHTTVAAIDGASGLIVTVGQDRDVYLEGLAGIRRVLTITAAVGGLAMLVSVILVRRTVGRLERLNDTAKIVSRRHDHAVRVVPEGRDEIASLARGINHMLDGLQGANEAKTRFLSRVSHEVNNPLNAISGHAQLLGLDDLTEDQADSVRNILQGSRHIGKLMAQFLDTARIEAGMIALEIKPCPVNDIIAEMLDLAEPLADSLSITATHLVPVEPQMAMVDATRLRQIVLNLITNAIKYNDPGGSIQISTRADEKEVRIAVTDTGIGISPIYLDRLFVPFDRLDADQGPNAGSGVGLAVSQQLVHLMGGELIVSSQVGEGSTFTVVLPSAPSTSSRSSATNHHVAKPVPVKA